MYDGHLVLTNSTTELYSPWLPREGDNGLFFLEMIAGHNATLTVKIFHKISWTAGDGAELTGFSLSRTSAGRVVAHAIGLRGIFRFKYRLVPTDGLNSAWVLFRMVKPAWYETVVA